jgi:hypothetical protein
MREASTSFSSFPQMQLIYLLQAWFLPLTLKGGEMRCGLRHHGRDSPTLIHLKCLVHLITWEHLRLMLDPENQLGLSLEVPRTILLEPCGI